MEEHMDSISYIPVIGSDKPAVVDHDDFRWAIAFTWKLSSNGYVVTYVNKPMDKILNLPRTGWWEMGHMVMVKNGLWPKSAGAFSGQELDHINRERSDADNTRNLYFVSDKRSVSGKGSWRVTIKVNGKNVHVGCFHSLKEAQNARDEYKRKHNIK
jgi:hypothetical protein